MQRRAKDCPADLEQKRRQWGKVHIAPGEVIAGCDEIEFIAKVAIAPVRAHLEEKCEYRESGRDFYPAGGEGRSISFRCTRSELCCLRHRGHVATIAERPASDNSVPTLQKLSREINAGFVVSNAAAVSNT